MRSVILSLSLAMALPMVPTMASATAHDCNQLRNQVRIAVPGDVRNLPYAGLDCNAIGEIHLLNSAHAGNHNFLSQRIEAIFRREGLIR